MYLTASQLIPSVLNWDWYRFLTLGCLSQIWFMRQVKTNTTVLVLRWTAPCTIVNDKKCFTCLLTVKLIFICNLSCGNNAIYEVLNCLQFMLRRAFVVAMPQWIVVNLQQCSIYKALLINCPGVGDFFLCLRKDWSNLN